MSLLFGKKPTRMGPTAAETAMGAQADRLESSRGGLDNVANLYMNSLARGRTAERSDALGMRNADVSQAFAAAGPATGKNQALNNLVTRGKGLSRVLQATSGEFDSQLLRDRVASVTGARNRQAKGMQVMQGVAGIQENLEKAKRGAQDADNATRSNTLGTIAGIGAGIVANRGNLFPGKTKLPGTYGMDVRTPSYDVRSGAGEMYA